MIVGAVCCISIVDFTKVVFTVRPPLFHVDDRLVAPSFRSLAPVQPDEEESDEEGGGEEQGEAGQLRGRGGGERGGRSRKMTVE